ncbi:MAG TPA: hypothetical protein VHT03_04530 [Rhizomicrobium sp.]|jgi:hypothetical protein|nr:hypothetical protein [Rhizomicrobium sp.]
MKLRHRALLGALLATTVPTLVAQTASAAEPVAQPAFTVLPPHGSWGLHAPASLATWSGSFTYSGHSYNITMVGANPASSNTTTTITTYIVPVIMKYTKRIYGASHKTFNPTLDQQNGVSIIQNLLNSPLFNNVDWNWGGTDVGTEEYVDAFQRAGFWGNVTTNTNYHVVLAPTVLSALTIKPTVAAGGKVVANPFGGTGKVGEMNLSPFDAQLQTYMRNNTQITPDTFVIFVTDNIYLTSGGCCIGGYHSANTNGQTYSTATYAYSPGAFVFSADISAFSHEIGEWYDDPLITSNSPCGLLEVGDPLEGKANYGDFSVTYNSVTWHPQALAMMEYFGEPANFSVNNWLDNQHIETSVCENGH